MKPKHTIGVLCAHAVLLLLASTRLSLVNWIWGKWAWTWDYFQYSYQNGWGYKYQSDYSLAVVLLYVGAFFVGLIGYLIAGARIALAWRAIAMVLCVLGLISFLLEASHWVWDHHLSWIAICPAASLLLAGAGIVQLGRTGKPGAPRSGGHVVSSRNSGLRGGPPSVS